MGFDNVNVNVSGPKQPTSTYKTKVLKGNHSFASQVTEPNMKYVIKYDFDLGGGEVTIPKNCVLEFDGGSLTNGTIIGTKTTIFGIPKISNYSGVFIDKEGCPLDKNLNSAIRGFDVEGVRANYDFATYDASEGYNNPIQGFSPNSFVIYEDKFIVLGYIKKTIGGVSGQYLYCVVFDTDYNTVGYGKCVDGNGVQLKCHAQGATIKDGLLYVSDSGGSQNVIFSTNIENLLSNVTSNIDITMTPVEIPHSGWIVTAVDWNEEHRRWAIELYKNGDNSYIAITDEEFNIIYESDVSIISDVRKYFPGVYALQDIVYDGYFIYGTCSSYGQAGSLFIIYDLDKQKIVTSSRIINRTETEGIFIKDGDIYIQGLDASFIPILKSFTDREQVVFARDILLGQSELEIGFSLYVDNSIAKDEFGKEQYPFKYLSTALYYSRLFDSVTIRLADSGEKYFGNINTVNDLSIIKWKGTGNPKVVMCLLVNSGFSELSYIDFYDMNYETVRATNGATVNISNCKFLSQYYVNVHSLNSNMNIDNCIFERKTDTNALNFSNGSKAEIKNVTLNGNSIFVERGSSLLISGNVYFNTHTYTGIDNDASMFRNSLGYIETTLSYLNIGGTEESPAPSSMFNNAYSDFDVLFTATGNDDVGNIIHFLNRLQIVPRRIGKIYIANSGEAGGTYGYSFNRGTFDIGGFGQTYVCFADNPLRGGVQANIDKIEAAIHTTPDEIMKACAYAVQYSGGYNMRYKYPVNWLPNTTNLRVSFINGFTAAITKGTTAQRPVGVHTSGGANVGDLYSSYDIGFEYYDTTLSKPIYVKAIENDGTITWVDATGTPV